MLKPNGPSKEFDDCMQDFSYLYVQAECKLSPAELHRNKEIAVVVCFFVAMIAVTYHLGVHYLGVQLELDIKTWDADTCSASDFSIMLHISENQFKNF